MSMPRKSPFTVTQVVGRNVRKIRRAREMHTTGVAQALTEAGWPCRHPAVSRIESGARAVTVDELVLLASVLGVANPWDLTKHSACPTCHGVPPAGFTCRTCRDGEDEPDAR